MFSCATRRRPPLRTCLGLRQDLIPGSSSPIQVTFVTSHSAVGDFHLHGLLRRLINAVVLLYSRYYGSTLNGRGHSDCCTALLSVLSGLRPLRKANQCPIERNLLRSSLRCTAGTGVERLT